MGLLLSPLRRRRPPSGDVPASPSPAGDAPSGPLPRVAPVAVTVSDRFAHHLAGLATALGPAYEVRPGPPDGAEVAVVEAGRPAAVAFLRARHPDLGLIVVTWDGAAHRPEAVVEHLEAGADDHLVVPTDVELAAHVRALHRRRARRPFLVR